MAKRAATMEAIVAEFPDFHERRRKIWSSFNMTFYPMEASVSFTTDPAKFYVATMYWQEEATGFDRFLTTWKKKMKKNGGTNLLELTNGQSPYGYHYKPDYFVLTEWASRAEFEAFYTQDQALDHKGVRHVNQIIVR
ncbi:MAG: hypothetical protein AAF840_11900 [Bacteroidota bacterium]